METCNECQSNKMSRRLGKKKYECDRQVIQKNEKAFHTVESDIMKIPLLVTVYALFYPF